MKFVVTLLSIRPPTSARPVARAWNIQYTTADYEVRVSCLLSSISRSKSDWIQMSQSLHFVMLCFFLQCRHLKTFQ